MVKSEWMVVVFVNLVKIKKYIIIIIIIIIKDFKAKMFLSGMD
jgi:hypothetical protein